MEELLAQLNLSIPLYVDWETRAQTAAATESATTALPDALAKGLESSVALGKSLDGLFGSALKARL